LAEEIILKVVEALSGESARKIVELLISTEKGMNDEEISNTLNARVNDVRRILYDLANNGFIAYRRSSGEGSRWYNYVWFTNKDMILQAISRRKKEVARVLNEWLSHSESLPTYICPFDFSLYTFDDAFENSFRCIKCGTDLVEVDNSKVVEFIKQLINKLSKSL
jgi:transcription initiation factor TFIIE subunit alpha